MKRTKCAKFGSSPFQGKTAADDFYDVGCSGYLFNGFFGNARHLYRSTTGNNTHDLNPISFGQIGDRELAAL